MHITLTFIMHEKTDLCHNDELFCMPIELKICGANISGMVETDIYNIIIMY